MSRIGKLPITLPAGVAVTVGEDNVITVKGPKGELQQQVNPIMKVEVDNGHLIIVRPDDEKENRALHGLYRSLLNNMVKGVTEGFRKEMELVGVGYRVTNSGQVLELSLGYYPHYLYGITQGDQGGDQDGKKQESAHLA